MGSLLEQAQRIQNQELDGPDELSDFLAHAGAHLDTLRASLLEIKLLTGLVHVSSLTSIPAGATVTSCTFTPTALYSPGTSSEAGPAGSSDLVMGPAQNDPTKAGVYAVEQITVWPATGPVIWAPLGAPLVGSGLLVVQYTPTPAP
jgi:hypothetical protein